MKALTVDDSELLLAFIEHRSERAFQELVNRHIGLVFSTALRRTGNRSMAEDVTQAVFIVLSKKAGRLTGRTTLSAWLHRAARLAAAQAVRNEARRARREASTAVLDAPLSDADAEARWNHAEHLLDQGIESLRAKDRDGLLLRYFENRSLEEVGSALGCSAEAAKKRVLRALEKLRRFLRRRGIPLSALVLGSLLAEKAVQGAPAGLAEASCGVALQDSSGMTGSILKLATQTMKTMFWFKLAPLSGALAALLVLAVAVPYVRSQQAGSLDTSFHTGDVLGFGDVRALALQADGKVLVAGSFTAYATNAEGTVLYEGLARLKPDGSLDTTLLKRGHYRNTQAIALQADGKIVVGGSAMTFQDAPPNDPMPKLPAVLRLNPDGTVDAGFNIGPNIDYTQHTWVYALAIQPDGRIVIGGNFTTIGGEARPSLARLNADGSLDPTFVPPASLVPPASQGGAVYRVLLQSDGKVLVTTPALRRLNPDGTADSTFNPYTKLTQPIALQPNQQVIASLTGPAQLTRVNLDGSLDPTFKFGGVTPADLLLTALAVEPGGNIIYCGKFTQASGEPRHQIARVNPDGTLDSSFDPGAGSGFNNSGGTPTGPKALLPQPDGKLLVSGDFETVNGTTNHYLVRLLAGAPFRFLSAAINSQGMFAGTVDRSGTNAVYIESSPDLRQWTRQAGLTNQNEVLTFSIPRGAPSRLFYRAVSE